MSPATAADLSIVVPTRGRPETLRRTIAALGAQTEQGFETIVVVDGADQEPPRFAGVRVIQQDHAGPGAARNRGVDASDRPLILFLGDDMIPRPELVARHLAVHRSEPAVEVGALGRIAWHPDLAGNRLRRWLDWSSALFEYDQLNGQEGRDVGWPRFYSSNVSLKRELFLAAGRFDPDFVFDYEDLDLAWRLGRRGLRLLYEAGALVEHLHPYDWEAVRQRYASRAGAERLMAAKHEWFEPWFYRQLDAARGEPRASPLWSYVVDLAPRRAPRVRRWLRSRANRHYLQRLAPDFFTAWDAPGSRHGGRPSAP